MRIRTIKSFKCAIKGIYYAFQEQTVRILGLIALIVVLISFLLNITFIEKTIVILVITFVLSLELINSQVERTLDIVEPNFSQRVREIKDISAGAVLIASIGAFLVGVLIFWPYITQFF